MFIECVTVRLNDLHFAHFFSHVLLLFLALAMFQLELLQLSFCFFPAMFRIIFTLRHRLELNLQLTALTLQSLLSFLHRRLVLEARETEQKCDGKRQKKMDAESLKMNRKINICLLCAHYPLSLFQLFIQLFESLRVFLPHLRDELLMTLCFILQSFLQLSHLRFPFSSM